MSGAVSRCYQRVSLPTPAREWASVLATRLGRFTADADTAPGFLERLRNRSAPKQCACPGAVAANHRRDTETGCKDKHSNKIAVCQMTAENEETGSVIRFSPPRSYTVA